MSQNTFLDSITNMFTKPKQQFTPQQLTQWNGYQTAGNTAYDNYVKSFDPSTAGGFDQLQTKQDYLTSQGIGMTQDDFLANQNQGFGVMDAVGLGMGAFNMYTNYTGQKEALDQNQQSLDLSKEKFAFLKQNQADTRAASKRNAMG
jgi:hypothetical protein